MLEPLARDQPNAPGGGVEKDGFTRLHTVNLTDQILNGQTFEHGCGGDFVRNVIGQAHRAIRLHYMRLSVRADRAGAIRNAVARFQIMDLGANFHHFTSGFEAYSRRRWNGVEAGAVIGVDII